MKFFFYFFLLLSSLPCRADPEAGAEPVQPTVITLDGAQRMSVENQPYLRLHDANNLASTSTRFFNADDPAMAQFKTAVEKFRYKQNPLTQDIVSLGESFLTPEQRAKILVTRNRQVRHGAETVFMTRGVARDAGLAWLRLYQARHALELRQSLQGEYQGQVAAARFSYGAGKMNADQVLQAEDSLNGILMREIELKNEAARAEGELVRWTGLKTFVLDSKIDLKPALSLQQMRERLPGHPQQQVFWLAKDVAEAEIDLVEDTYKPDPKIEFHPQDVIFAALKTLREKIDYQAENSMRVLEAELITAYANWESAQGRRDLHEKKVLPNAVARLNAVTVAYGSGKADFSAVLDARRHELESRIEQLDLQIAAAKARIELGFYE